MQRGERTSFLSSVPPFIPVVLLGRNDSAITKTVIAFKELIVLACGEDK